MLGIGPNRDGSAPDDSQKRSELTAAAAAAMVVVIAAFDAAKTSCADVKPLVEPELKPYHPTQRMRTPLKTDPTS